MAAQFLNSMVSEGFTSIWHKYKAVLVQLMMASESEPQQYQFFLHEFKSRSLRQKDFTFTLTAHRGKAVNNIRSSPIAADLLYILNMSRKATELMETNSYEFSLNKEFMLQVIRQEPPMDIK